MSVGDVSVPHIALQLGSRRSFSSPVVCELGFRPALTAPCDRGRFHAEPVKDICTRRPGAPAVVGYPPRAFCDLATWPPRSASRRPVTRCDLSPRAELPVPLRRARAVRNELERRLLREPTTSTDVCRPTQLASTFASPRSPVSTVVHTGSAYRSTRRPRRPVTRRSGHRLAHPWSPRAVHESRDSPLAPLLTV